jgi:uncharacterized protein
MPLDPPTIAAIVATLVAGLVRGFSGFGGALIFVPLAAAAVGPPTAAACLLVMDLVLTLPMVCNAVRICRWNTLLPVAAGAVVTIPFGAAILAQADPLVLRWGLAVLVMVLLALLVSGLRYSGEPHRLASLGVGGVAGLLSGIGQVGGPPVIAFWVAGPLAPAIIRANLIMFFCIASASSSVSYYWNGFFTGEMLSALMVFAPVYAVALFIGTRLFGKAPERYYRRIAYVVIAIAAITSIPALDGILR